MERKLRPFKVTLEYRGEKMTFTTFCVVNQCGVLKLSSFGAGDKFIRMMLRYVRKQKRPRVTRAQVKDIAHNMRYGLLCACNRTRVPYFPLPGHGVKITRGKVHGYAHCRDLAIKLKKET